MGWKEHLNTLGYDIDGTMSAAISLWYQWYTAKHEFYSSTSTDASGRTFKVERISVKPARMVCQEWASLLMNERTMVSTGNDMANEWLERYLTDTRFMQNSQGLVERGFALGTAAWALRVEGAYEGSAQADKVRIITQRFDARHIAPISYDEDACTACAFASEVVIDGKKYEQIQIHKPGEGDRYFIETIFLNASGEPQKLDGFPEEPFDTKCKTPTFALVRPGLENTVADFSPFGVSVFDDAIGAVQLVDEAFDMMHNDLYLGRKRLFLDERMLGKDANGNVTVPWAEDQQLFRQTEAGDSSGTSTSMIEEYNPDLRVTETRSALNTALEMLGTRCGFGGEYFSLEGASGMKTATEVVADGSDLFRNVRKHENELAPAIQTIITAILTMARELQSGTSIPADFGAITVTFDDSVIEDTEAQRKRDRDDVAGGLMFLWEYREKWYGEDEDTAKASAEALVSGDIPLEE